MSDSNLKPGSQETIDRITELLSLSINNLREAANLYVGLAKRDPNAIIKLRNKLGGEMLRCLSNIGNGLIHYKLFADPSEGSKRLRSMPIEIQNEWVDKRIPTTVKTYDAAGNLILTDHKLKARWEISKDECQYVFESKSHVRSLDEQRRTILAIEQKKLAARSNVLTPVQQVINVTPDGIEILAPTKLSWVYLRKLLRDHDARLEKAKAKKSA